MTSTPHAQTKLDRAVAWMERENERSDKALLARPDWWHAGKILFGGACIARSVKIAMDATGPVGYVFAALFLVGGAYMACEGFKVLRARRAQS